MENIVPKILTFADRQTEFDAKFKSTGVTLKTYEGTLKPCVIHCEIHGDQTVSTYNNAFKSKKGCPKCGLANQGYHAGKLSDDEYLKLFHEVHGDKYTYDMTRDEKYRITIHCPIHGDSKVMPSRVAKGVGCPKCGREANMSNLSRAGRPKKSS